MKKKDIKIKQIKFLFKIKDKTINVIWHSTGNKFDCSKTNYHDISVREGMFEPFYISTAHGKFKPNVKNATQILIDAWDDMEQYFSNKH